MNQIESAEFVSEHLNSHCRQALRFLGDTLRLPERLLAMPSELEGLFNEQRLRVFTLNNGELEAEEGNGAGRDIGNRDAACYAPEGGKYAPAILVNTDTLRSDAGESAIPEDALLHILVAHEAVHAVMMTRFARVQQAAAKAWTLSPEYRHIHEACALRFSERLADPGIGIASAAHVATYMKFVDRRSLEASENGVFYRPYFERLRSVPDAQFWVELIKGGPDLDGLLALDV